MNLPARDGASLIGSMREICGVLPQTLSGDTFGGHVFIGKESLCFLRKRSEVEIVPSSMPRL